jgi:ankyrin repeat protein
MIPAGQGFALATACRLLLLAAVAAHGCSGKVSEQQRRLTGELVLAAVAANTAEVDRLIAVGADVNGEAGFGTPLEAVVDRGNVDMIRHLVGKGARIGWYNPPLPIRAIKADRDEALLALLDLGAAADCRADGFTPLAIAVSRGRPELVRALLERKANPRPFRGFGVPQQRTTLLHLAASSGDLETFTIVARLFPDLKLVDGCGRNALHAVCGIVGSGNDRAVILERLLAAGVDPHARMNDKQVNDLWDAAIETPLQAAAANGWWDLVAILVDKVGHTPAELTAALPLAVRNEVPVPTIERMIAAGADLNAAGPFPPTLHIAIERGSPAMVSALLAAGADATRANARGEDALALARIRAARGRKVPVGGVPYHGESKDAPDAGQRILELVSEHGAR